MTRSTIYTVDAAGTLTAMRPSEPRSEDFMQKLVADHPQLIADEDGALLLIRREQPIADREDGSGRWSLDHLFVTRGGVPVLVELKRAADTRLRREVVGQMLDYAANGTAYWQGGRLAESYAATMTALGRDPDVELATFLLGASDPQEFWEQVDANFAAGRIKLIFVADTIPRELARIVEFLNEQMKADVRAVELSWFESEGGVTTLAPRVIGETERAQTEKVGRSALPPIDRESWIKSRLGEFGAETLAGAAAYIAAVENAEWRTVVTSTQGSIIATRNAPAGALIPFGLSADRRGSVMLCLGNLRVRPGFTEEEDRRRLYDKLTEIVGPLSTSNFDGFPKFSVAKLRDPEVRAAFEELLHEIRIVGEAF